MAGKTTKSIHDAQSLSDHAAILEAQAVVLRSAVSQLNAPPKIQSVTVPLEDSRKVGFNAVPAWAHAAWKAAVTARGKVSNLDGEEQPVAEETDTSKHRGRKSH